MLRDNVTTLEACWKWRVGLLGRAVVAECPGGLRRGRLLEMGFDGLHLEQPDGEVLCLPPERVLHLYQR